MAAEDRHEDGDFLKDQGKEREPEEVDSREEEEFYVLHDWEEESAAVEGEAEEEDFLVIDQPEGDSTPAEEEDLLLLEEEERQEPGAGDHPEETGPSPAEDNSAEKAEGDGLAVVEEEEEMLFAQGDLPEEGVFGIEMPHFGSADSGDAEVPAEVGEDPELAGDLEELELGEVGDHNRVEHRDTVGEDLYVDDEIEIVDELEELEELEELVEEETGEDEGTEGLAAPGLDPDVMMLGGMEDGAEEPGAGAGIEEDLFADLEESNDEPESPLVGEVSEGEAESGGAETGAEDEIGVASSMMDQLEQIEAETEPTGGGEEPRVADEEDVDAVVREQLAMLEAANSGGEGFEELELGLSEETPEEGGGSPLLDLPGPEERIDEGGSPLLDGPEEEGERQEEEELPGTVRFSGRQDEISFAKSEGEGEEELALRPLEEEELPGEEEEREDGIYQEEEGAQPTFEELYGIVGNEEGGGESTTYHDVSDTKMVDATTTHQPQPVHGPARSRPGWRRAVKLLGAAAALVGLAGAGAFLLMNEFSPPAPGPESARLERRVVPPPVLPEGIAPPVLDSAGGAGRPVQLPEIAPPPPPAAEKGGGGESGLAGGEKVELPVVKPTVPPQPGDPEPGPVAEAGPEPVREPTAETEPVPPPEPKPVAEGEPKVEPRPEPQPEPGGEEPAPTGELAGQGESAPGGQPDRAPTSPPEEKPAGEEEKSPPQPTRLAWKPEEMQRGTAALALLRNGNYFEGKVWKIDQRQVTLQLVKGEVTFFQGDLYKLLPMSSTLAQRIRNSAAGFVRLKNANSFSGRILIQDDQSVVLQCRKGRIAIPREKIARVKEGKMVKLRFGDLGEEKLEGLGFDKPLPARQEKPAKKEKRSPWVNTGALGRLKTLLEEDREKNLAEPPTR